MDLTSIIQTLNQMAMQLLPILLLLMIVIIIFYTSYLFFKVVKSGLQLQKTSSQSIKGIGSAGEIIITKKRITKRGIIWKLKKLFKRGKKHIFEIESYYSHERIAQQSPLRERELGATSIKDEEQAEGKGVKDVIEPKDQERRDGPEEEKRLIGEQPEQKDGSQRQQAIGEAVQEAQAKESIGLKEQDEAKKEPESEDVTKRFPVTKISFEEVKKTTKEAGEKLETSRDQGNQRESMKSEEVKEQAQNAEEQSKEQRAEHEESDVAALLGVTLNTQAKESLKQEIRGEIQEASESLGGSDLIEEGNKKQAALEVDAEGPLAPQGNIEHQEADELAELLGRASKPSPSREDLGGILMDLANNLKKLRDKLASFEVKIARSSTLE